MHFTRFFLMGIIKPTVQLYFRNSSDFCGKPFKIILYLWCTTFFYNNVTSLFLQREKLRKKAVSSVNSRVIRNFPIFAIIPIFNGLSHNSALCKNL